MQSSWNSVALFVALTCAVGLNRLQGQESAGARVDAHGDPLPVGALARLGTLRLVHLGGLSAVGITADGKIIASGVSDGSEIQRDGKPITLVTIRLWDGQTGKRIREIVTPDAPVSAIAFDPMGRLLFAGCGKFLCCWEVSTGKRLWSQEAVVGGRFLDGVHAQRIVVAQDRLFSIHRGELGCPKNEDGEICLFSHAQHIVRCWNDQTGKPLPISASLQSTIRTETRIPVLFHEVAVSPNGSLAAVVVSRQAEPLPRDGADFQNKWRYKDYCLQIIDIDRGTVTHSLADDNAAIQKLAFAEDGQTLAFAVGSEIVKLQTANGKRTALARNLPSWVHRLAFLDKTRLAAQLGDKSMHLWDTASGKCLESQTIGTHHFKMANSGRRIVTWSGSTVQVLDRDSGKPLLSLAAHRWTPSIRFALHSKDTLISRDFDRAYRWNMRSWTPRAEFVLTKDHYFRWHDMDRCDLDEIISIEKEYYLKDVQKGVELRDIKTDRLVRPIECAAGMGYAARFCAAGNRFFTRNVTSIRFFDIETGNILASVPRSGGFEESDLLSPYGKFFATNDGSYHTDISVFDVGSGTLLRNLGPGSEERGGAQDQTFRFRFSADEQVILAEVAGEKVRVRLWDLDSGKLIREIVPWPTAKPVGRRALMESRIGAFALSRDRRLLAITPKDGKTIEVWEVASGTKRGELPGHDGRVADLDFSPDDRQLASSSEDTTVLVWDLNRPLQAGKFKGRLSQEELAAHWKTLFMPDARSADTAIWSLVTAGDDSIPFLKKHLRPDARHIQNLLTALDSISFPLRAKAEAELEGYGELILAELETSVKQNGSLEKQRRLQRLLNKAKTPEAFGTPERVAHWRCVEIIERIGTADAKQLLRELADGSPAAQLTIAARLTLTREASLAANQPEPRRK